jgi:SNF2 family DNA or RNA helicase
LRFVREAVRAATLRGRQLEDIEEENEVAVDDADSSDAGDAGDAGGDKAEPHSIFDDTKYLDIEGLDHSEAMAGDTAFVNPTEKSVENFELQQEWFDNTAYQREDHADACLKLGCDNPDVPRIPGMRVAQKLKFWQPVAVKALLDFEDSGLLRGAILADGVGLGKTWTSLAYLLTVWINPFFGVCLGIASPASPSPPPSFTNTLLHYESAYTDEW